MNKLIYFYQNLDSFNLIIFWGIILIIILLIIFIILEVLKKKTSKKNIPEELIEEDNLPLANYSEQIKYSENNYNNQSLEELPDLNEIKQEKTIEIELPKTINIDKTEQNLELPTVPEFIAEDYVKEEPINNVVTKSISTNFVDERKPYQRNVLKEMSLGQTSPINIIKNDTVKNNIKIKKSEASYESLNINTKESQLEKQNKITDNKVNYNDEKYNNEKEKYIEERKKYLIEQQKKIEENKTNNNQDKLDSDNSLQSKYLQEVSEKLSQSQAPDEIKRTAYEIMQEEDAIISYEELMQKKDSIKIVDEEDAIISIEELMERKKEEEKLYKITEDAENNHFIDELKQFREDL